MLICRHPQLFDQDKDGRVSFDEARALICKSLRCGCLSMSFSFVKADLRTWPLQFLWLDFVAAVSHLAVSASVCLSCCLSVCLSVFGCVCSSICSIHPLVFLIVYGQGLAS